jgi:hypothetical protein
MYLKLFSIQLLMNICLNYKLDTILHFINALVGVGINHQKSRDWKGNRPKNQFYTCFGNWWPSQPIELTTFDKLWFQGLKKHYKNVQPWKQLSQTVWAHVADRLRHFGQELCLSTHLKYRPSKGEKSTIRNQARIVWPAGVDRLPIENQKKPAKVPCSVKLIFSVHADHPGARPDRPHLLCQTSDDAFNVIIVVDIAVTTDHCKSNRWCAGVDRPGEGSRLSACGRKLAMTRK